MLKKLNGKFTKLLFYIKNNFLYFIFKLSLMTTMLILIYLVCVLSQPNVARSTEYSGVSPIEHFEQLMLVTSPTEMPSNLDNLFTTTEVLATIENSIPKISEDFDTHPLFPLQEQTPTPLVIDETTKYSRERETTSETSVIPNPESTVLFEQSDLINELKMWSSTTDSLRTETIPTSTAVYSKENEEETSTNSVISTTLFAPYETKLDSTPMPTDVANPDDLFVDNWPLIEQPLKHDDIQIQFSEKEKEDIPFALSDIKEPPPDSFFLNEEDELSGLIATSTPRNESEHTNVVSREEKEEKKLQQSSVEEMKHSQEDLQGAKINKNKMVALETPSIFSPDNLFNLFNLDHIPANSNRKAVWWSKSKNGPISAPADPVKVKNRKRQVNEIHPIYEDAHESPRIFNQLFNRKFKDSVNFLERFFGNFMME